mmetsp:Transcript_51708/g.133453  ORF Transcript_51708/g.133453 Transcript_51708/m.133453 type:complete len:247 (+) Transcript_51708:48-788(+)
MPDSRRAGRRHDPRKGRAECKASWNWHEQRAEHVSPSRGKSLESKLPSAWPTCSNSKSDTHDSLSKSTTVSTFARPCVNVATMSGWSALMGVARRSSMRSCKPSSLDAVVPLAARNAGSKRPTPLGPPPPPGQPPRPLPPAPAAGARGSGVSHEEPGLKEASSGGRPQGGRTGPAEEPRAVPSPRPLWPVGCWGSVDGEAPPPVVSPLAPSLTRSSFQDKCRINVAPSPEHPLDFRGKVRSAEFAV